jgi:hypothetical protein
MCDLLCTKICKSYHIYEYIYGLIILQNITIQNTHKINFKHESLKMLVLVSKHNITKKKKKKKHCPLKYYNEKMII